MMNVWRLLSVFAPDSRAIVFGGVTERAPSNDSLSWITDRPCAAVVRRSNVVVMPNVFNVFPNIAKHIVQEPRICRVTAYPAGGASIFAVIGVFRREIVPNIESTLCASSTGVFPFSHSASVGRR